MRNSRWAAFLGCGLLCLMAMPGSAPAATLSFSQIYSFGDSLSDNGNAALALGGALPGDYAPNELTDGLTTTPSTTVLGLWIEQFAALAQLPIPQPYLANPLANTNYAVASAQTGSANPQDLSNQLLAFLAAHPAGAPSTGLYTFWAGANDLYNGSRTGTAAADNIAANIQTLGLDGAQTFLWLNLPNLGSTPRGAANATVLDAQTAAFNAEWAKDIALLDASGLHVIGVDVNTLFQNILTSPQTFGFTNVTSPAQGLAVNPNTYLFWDIEHPTTAADSLVAQLALTDLVATPEPASMALMTIGFGGVFAVARRRRNTLRQ